MILQNINERPDSNNSHQSESAKPHTKPTPATLTKPTRLAHKMNDAICSKRVLALVMFCNSRFSTAIGIYVWMDVLSYSCSHVSFFSLSLSVGISPGVVPEARVCAFSGAGIYGL
jgi:hypothetical protein